jgi:hypothetical protein
LNYGNSNYIKPKKSVKIVNSKNNNSKDNNDVDDVGDDGDDVDDGDSHVSEKELEQIHPEYTVINDGSLEKLYMQIENILEKSQNKN